MDPYSNLPWRAWLYLATLRHMDSAQALAHARACPACTEEIARLTGRRALETAA